MNSKMKAIVGLFVACAAACFGLAVFFAVKGSPVGTGIVFTVIGVLCLLPILPAVNRRVRLFEDGFTYRTWLGNEYRFRYSDVRYYKLGDHDLYLYTAKRRLIVDRDVEDADAVKKQLDAHAVPNHEPVDTENISDDAGEAPLAVYYRKQRVFIAVIMLSVAALYLAGIVLLTIFVPVRTEADKRSMILLYALFGVGAPYLIGLSMYSLNGRVECYREHFVYRTWTGRRREYAYSDCISKKVREYRNTMSDQNRIYSATIRMKDGSRIRVDNRMLEDGLAASLNFQNLPMESYVGPSDAR